MSYELEFNPQAWKEWQKLDASIREQFKNKLASVLQNPEIPANQLSGFPHCYKIKLRKAGYRLVYQVQQKRITVYVVAIGKRDRLEAYKIAKSRLAH